MLVIVMKLSGLHLVKPIHSLRPIHRIQTMTVALLVLGRMLKDSLPLNPKR